MAARVFSVSLFLSPFYVASSVQKNRSANGITDHDLQRRSGSHASSDHAIQVIDVSADLLLGPRGILAERL